MHGLVNAQPLPVGPVQDVPALARHFRGTVYRGERDVLGVGIGFKFFQDRAQGDALPGNHHGPGLDTAQPVNPFFQLRGLEKIFQIINTGFFTFPLDRDGPGAGLEFAGIAGRIPFIRAEFVEIVITGYRIIGGEFFIGGIGAFINARQFGPGPGGNRGQHARGQQGARHTYALDEFAPGKVQRFVRDLRRLNIGRFFYQHGSESGMCVY